MQQTSILPDTPKVFNGSYTLINQKTGEHRTVQIKTQKEQARFAPGERIIALLSGPNNESDYTGFGFVGDSVRVWRSKINVAKPTAFEFIADMLNVKLFALPSLYRQDYSHYACQIEKRCLRCNRKLTHPESLRTGYGPECIDL